MIKYNKKKSLHEELTAALLGDMARRIMQVMITEGADLLIQKYGIEPEVAADWAAETVRRATAAMTQKDTQLKEGMAANAADLKRGAHVQP